MFCHQAVILSTCSETEILETYAEAKVDIFAGLKLYKQTNKYVQLMTAEKAN